jgi:homoserine trans-succinylase
MISGLLMRFRLNCLHGAMVTGHGINRNKQQEIDYTDLLVSVARFKKLNVLYSMRMCFVSRDKYSTT